MLRAVLLAAAIANAAAFIAPAPQWLAPQLAAGRAAVLPPRALPTASVTRRDEVNERYVPLQVCPARHPVALSAWPRCLHKGYGGRKGSPECIPSKCLCGPPTPPYVQSPLSVVLSVLLSVLLYALRSLITFKVCSPHAGAKESPQRQGSEGARLPHAVPCSCQLHLLQRSHDSVDRS